MAKGGDTIVVKKIKKGGHGHHGGAWKVAFADFMTAMMAFFLVMWLMAADEDTKAEIAHYFNHPNTPFKQGRDPNAATAHPLGEKNGVGDSILNGQEGMVPETMVQTAMRPMSDALSEFRDLKAKIQSELDAIAYGMDVELDVLKFSISEEELFEPGVMELKPGAEQVLDKVGQVLSRFPGYVTITGHEDSQIQHSSGISSYEFTMARAVAVMHFMVQNSYMAEERISPMGRGAKAPYSNPDSSTAHSARRKNNRIEFILSHSQKL